MVENLNDKKLSFPGNRGEMSELISLKSWSQTSLGPLETWPQSLKTTVGIMLNSQFPMFLFWGDDLICLYNDAFRPSLGNDGKHPDMLGQKAENAWAEVWEDLIKPQVDAVRNGNEHVWHKDQLIPFYRNGKVEDVYWTYGYSPVYDENHELEGILITCVETTKKVLSLAEAKDKLLLSVNELKKKNDELKSFVYIASHDLQEPLVKIQAFSARIAQKEIDNLSEKGQEYFKRIENSTKRMRQLIEDLLAYSRTNVNENKFERTSLSSVIEQVKSVLDLSIRESGASISLKDDQRFAMIVFQMQQLFTNLISNSIKFSAKDRTPKIEINSRVINGSDLEHTHADAKKKYCHIAYRDNGIGFNEQHRERIFEIFQRLHGKSDYPGTGIGLAIVKKIVENHHGFIEAHSPEDIGAHFNIYLPMEQTSPSS